MSFESPINAYFVTTPLISKPPNVLKDFEDAFEELSKLVPEQSIRRIDSSTGIPLISSGLLSKTDVFVFDLFEGDFFEKLQTTKSLIIGPRSLLECLEKDEPIPFGSSPIYTNAMRDLKISATGITPDQKDHVRKLIEWMGGNYNQNFGRSVTHLISNTIKSTKYEQATLNGIPVMHVDWVQRVWDRSTVDFVSATSDEFQKYHLPIFFNTNITCTGLDTQKKNKVMRLVNENGGTYHSAFRSQLVDIVITEKDKTKSDKYKAAVAYKKDILLPEWIFDSVERGFALPTKKYNVKTVKVSTPTKTDQTIADFSQLSDISRISVGSKGNMLGTTINDTISSTMSNLSPFVRPAQMTPTKVSSGNDLQREILKKSGVGNQYRLVFDEICPKQAKKAGNFLDGCCIYLSGFLNEEREKLIRILNVGGATRYDVMNEEITHIIVGAINDDEFKDWKKNNIPNSVNIVRLEWLLESIKKKQPASEIVYRISMPTSREPDAPSPSSKRTLRSMNQSFKQPDLPSKKKLFGKESETKKLGKNALKPLALSNEKLLDDEEQTLISQYSQENLMPPPMPLPKSQQKKQQEETMQDNTMANMEPAASSTHLNINAAAENPKAQAVPKPANVAPQNVEDNTNSELYSIDYANLNFFQGMSIYIDKDNFPEEFYTQMIHECDAANGNIVASTYKDVVDYAVVSFERTVDVSKMPVKAKHIITELYVESCLKANNLVPVEYYHKHIPHTADSKPLENMIIVISTYTGLERDFIDSIASLMGAKLNNTFVKKERPLLVCIAAEGSKYEAALKWRYPVVSSEWLVNCAKEGKKLPYHDFLIGESPDNFPISPTIKANENTKELVKLREAILDGSTTPPTIEFPRNDDFTPLRNKRVSELAGPSRNNNSGFLSPNCNAATTSSMDSPKTPINTNGQGSYNYDFMERIVAEIENEAERECLREVLEEMRNNQTPELERIRRQACTPINRKLPTPKGLPDFCTTPEFEKRIADEFERRWRLPTKKIKPDTPIDEIRRRVLYATCKAMGIPVSDDDADEEKEVKRKSPISAQPSHLLTNSRKQNKTPSSSTIREQDNTPSTSTIRDLDETPLHSKSSIMPRSIFRSQSLSTSTDTYIPPTQTPPGNLSASASASVMGPRVSLGKSTIDFDKISFEDTEVERNRNSTISGVASKNNTITAAASNSNISTNASNSTVTSAASHSSPEIKQITDYLKNCESRRRQSLKRSTNTINLPQQKNDEDEAMETEVAYVQPFESEQFGAGTEDLVGWRDPVEFSNERRSKAATRSMQYEGTPRFSISCSELLTRQELIEKILKLGGTLCENFLNYDPLCTHFVCERPNRGEKIVGCISSGKWVLSTKYIEECHAKDVFIDEELYEWGNSKAVNVPQLTEDEKVIAHAAHYWRKHLQTQGGGAFSGIRALLRLPERTYDAMKSILKAGQGEVVDTQPPYSIENNAHLATHCFVDIKKAPLTQPDFDFLRKHNVKILTQMYINAFLMNGGKSDDNRYEVTSPMAAGGMKKN